MCTDPLPLHTPNINFVIGFEKRAHLERNLDFGVVTLYEREVSKLPVALCLEFVAVSDTHV